LILGVREDLEPVDWEVVEDPPREQADGAGPPPAAALLAGEEVADLAPALLPIDVNDAGGAEQPIGLGVGDEEVQSGSVSLVGGCPRRPLVGRLLAVVLGHPRPAGDLRVSADGDERGHVGIAPQPKPDLAVADALDRELERWAQAVEAAGAAARSTTRSAMSAMIRFSSKSFGV